MKPANLKNTSNDALPVAPLPEEIEVSVFGPGYGESILVHIGYDHWLIVDSCVDRTTGDPAALNYLNKIDVDPKHAVKKVIASHWHDDHIRGLSRIIEVCESADVFCSGALEHKEFRQLLALYSKNPMMVDTGLRDITQTVNILKKRNKKAQLVSENQVIWRKFFTDEDGDRLSECEVSALSPSSHARMAAYHDFDIPGHAEAKKRVLATSPNKNSVVLWISIGPFKILLGSDLEETGTDGTGWSAIVNSDARPEGLANFYKIPHHGSRNAHHQEVWEQMLGPDPVAVLTPFRNLIPTNKDIERLCSLSENVYSTARIESNDRPKRDPTVEKAIKETVKKITCNTSIGQVRLRISKTGEATIDVFGDAFQLSAK